MYILHQKFMNFPIPMRLLGINMNANQLLLILMKFRFKWLIFQLTIDE